MNEIHVKPSVRQRKEIIPRTTGCGWGGDGLAEEEKGEDRGTVKSIIFFPGEQSLDSLLNKVDHSSGFLLCKH